MTFIGVRCSNKDFSYAILAGTREQPTVQKTNTVRFPNGYTEPELFRWLYQEWTSVLAQTDCDAIAIKKPESAVSRSNSLDLRLQVAAIVSLAAADQGVLSVVNKVNATIAKDLGLKGKAKYLKTQLDTSPIADFETYSEKIKESLLAAWSCM